MGANVIVANTVITCGICRKQISIGQRIAHDKKAGTYCHADCIWPNKSKSSTPEPALGRKIVAQAGVPSAPQSASTSAEGDIPRIVATRLETAEAILLKKVPEAKEFSDYYCLLTEVMKQLQSEEWLQIEKHRVR